MDRKDSIIKKVEVLVKGNLIEDALTELERCVSINYYDLKKDIILLKSRCSDIRQRRSHGVIDFKEEVVELNKIKSSIVDLLDRIKIDVQKIEFSEENIREKQWNSLLQIKHKHRVFDEWLRYFSRKVFPLLPIGFIVFSGYFFSKIFYIDIFINPKVETKFTLLMNKNEFNKANMLIDSVYSLNPDFRKHWDSYRQEVFSRNLEFVLINNRVDSAKTLFYNYKFSYLFPDNQVFNGNYNSEVQWFNAQISKALFVFCKNKSYDIINAIIQDLCRPIATGDAQKIRTEFGEYQKDFKIKDDMLQVLETSCR